jgi:putative copper resistance protein D
MWAAGDLIGLVVVAALFVQWSRADEREAMRTDRQLDRVARAERERREERELAAYNARLSALAQRDAEQG